MLRVCGWTVSVRCKTWNCWSSTRVCDVLFLLCFSVYPWKQRAVLGGGNVSLMICFDPERLCDVIRGCWRGLVFHEEDDAARWTHELKKLSLFGGIKTFQSKHAESVFPNILQCVHVSPRYSTFYTETVFEGPPEAGVTPSLLSSSACSTIQTLIFTHVHHVWTHSTNKLFTRYRCDHTESREGVSVHLLSRSWSSVTCSSRLDNWKSLSESSWFSTF